MRTRYLLTLTCAVAVLPTPGAAAQSPLQPTPSGIGFQYSIAADGRGTVIASPPGGRGAIGWASCAGGGPACMPVASRSGNDQVLEVGDAAAGTVFEATATEAGRSVSARSVPYQGRVRWTEAPALAGPIRVDSLVRPLPARWEGGWGLEGDYLQLQVCRTASARRCLVIADTSYWNRCPGTGAVIPARYAGWYLRATDRRNARDMPILAIAYATPEAISPAIPGPATAVTPAVRIRPAAGPPTRRCGQSRLRDVAQLYPHLARLRGAARPAIGTLRCIDGCRFTVTVRRRGLRARFSRRAAAGTLQRPIVLPPKLQARLRGSRPRVEVEIDGRTVATGRVRMTS